MMITLPKGMFYAFVIDTLPFAFIVREPVGLVGIIRDE